MNKELNILICPLDWGIGHATRCIPIINKLLEKNINVIIGADKRPLAYLKNEYPELKFIRFPGYDVTYPSKGGMVMKMILLSPKIIKGIRKEQKLLKKIIAENQIHGVISDNRFGLWSKEVPSIYITHQVAIKAPKNIKWIEKILFNIHTRIIRKYDQCWVPDYQSSENLSGTLSHNLSKQMNLNYIGPLSRFNENKQPNEHTGSKYKILVLISGPEPQRTVFQNIIIEQLKNINKKTLILTGTPEKNICENITGNLTLMSNMKSEKLRKTILDSKIIICRPGYSTLMDLVALGKNAVFIPTPGQTEQEYLAKYHYEKKHFYYMNQNKADLKFAILKAEEFKGFQPEYDPGIPDEQIGQFIVKIKNH